MPLDYTLELPNDLRSIEPAVAFLVERSLEAGFHSDRLRLNLRVSLTEALANAILYGNAHDPSKRVRVDARVAADEVVVRVTDEGHGFDPDSVPDPTLPDNLTRAGGRGLFLIRNLMDSVEFNPAGNAITMVLRREDGPAQRRRGTA